MLIKRNTITLLFSFVLGGILQGQPTGRKIMENLDALLEPRDVVTQLKMTLVSVKGGKERRRSREMTIFEKRYENESFNSKSLIRFSQPAEVKGTGFLTWDRKGSDPDDQWLYLPALKKMKRIRAKEKTRNFLGTDFTYEDLSGRDLDADEYKLLGEDTMNGTDCYRVEAKPKEKNTRYSSRIIWVDKDRWLMKRVEFFDRKGRPLKVLNIPYHVKNGDYWTAIRLVMENLKTRHKTIMEVLKVDYDQGLGNEVFTESFLKRP